MAQIGDSGDYEVTLEDLLADAEKNEDSFSNFLEARAKKGEGCEIRANVEAGSKNGSKSPVSEPSDSSSVPGASGSSAKLQENLLAKYPGLLKTEPTQDGPEGVAPEVIISDVDPEPSSPIPGMAQETETRLTLHDHPIVGQYVHEETVVSVMDERSKEIWLGSYKLAVEEMTMEQIIERVHLLEREIKDRRVMQNSLTEGLQDHLGRSNSKRRGQIAEFDKAERAKYAGRKVRTEKKESKSRAPKDISMKAGKVNLAGLKGGSLTAATLFNMGLDREAITSQLEKRKALDDGAKAFVDKLFA